MSENEIINRALKRLSELFDDDMHGFRSEVWGVIAEAIREPGEPGPATKELLEKLDGVHRVSQHRPPKYKYDHEGHVYEVAETTIGLSLIRRFLQEWAQ